MLIGGYMAGSRVGGDQTQAVVQTPADPGRAEIEGIVRSYLIANPEVLVEAQQALEVKQTEQQRMAQVEVIREAGRDIFDSEHDGIYGDPAAKYTLVEFFDYNCGYCKRAMDDMVAMTAANPDVRFILKEFPILGPDSQRAHMVAQAFRNPMPQQYGEYHTRLLGNAGRATEDSAVKLAVSLGADEQALRKEMLSPAIAATFNRTYELANQLGITGTPSYVVGEEVVFGALGRDVLEEKVAQLRECSSATC